MKHLLSITKAFSDASRLRILCALEAHGELCVCQLQELLGLAPSTTSKHLDLLSQAGLVDSRKEGRWVHYRLTGADAPEPVRAALAWVSSFVSREKLMAEDRKALRRILRLTKEQLCQQQAKDSACCSSAPATPAAARWPKDGRARPKAT